MAEDSVVPPPPAGEAGSSGTGSPPTEATPAVPPAVRSPIRTYKSDIAEAVQKKKETVSSIFSAEEARRSGRGETTAEKPADAVFLGFRTKTSAFLTLASIIVLIAGAGVLSLVFFAREEEEPVITPAAQALLFVNKEIKVPVGAQLDEKAVADAVTGALMGKGFSFNDFVAVSFVRERHDAETETITEEVVPIGEILAAIALRMPPGFPRALRSEYLYGVHSLIETHPFLIMKTDSYENAFGYLFEWGGFPVVEDLAPLFGITRFPPPEVNDFTDILIKNRDARVISDAARVPILYYSFVDRETLVFTTDRTTFDEILNRLATPKRTLR